MGLKSPVGRESGTASQRQLQFSATGSANKPTKRAVWDLATGDPIGEPIPLKNLQFPAVFNKKPFRIARQP
jgi:hypothetical protein